MARSAPKIKVARRDRAQLERQVRSLQTPQGIANRARIVLDAAEGLSNLEIAAKLHVSSATVGKWRLRYNHWGMSGLEDEKRSGRPSGYESAIGPRLRELLIQPPTDGKRRWTIRTLADELDVPRSSLHDLLRKMDLPRSRYLPWRLLRA